ncbi:sensor histidine kinase [Cohnella sp. 56]|uniref:sensor histidine kinase n=1 Tax=Cohnella sp. 56 TaxID=3113722 RepID=UPI0030E76DB6
MRLRGWQVQEGLACIRNYFGIIDIRIRGCFRFEWDVGSAILECRVIKFNQQPIVENAIYHGLKPWLEADVLLSGVPQG